MDIKEIAKKILNDNGRIYLVGGAVRDILLGIEPKDYDYCVTGLSQEEFQNLFPSAFLRGKDFPVFDLDGIEIALARRERKIKEGHQGFIIEADKSLTIEDDLMRRDITVNSIAIDVLTNKRIDPYHGIEDIKNRVIRATSEAFAEDPLRVYRVARFSAQLNFKIDRETMLLMKSLKDELQYLSAERVFTEFRKALLSKHPSVFFQVLKECECLEVHFQEINEMIGITQPLKYHPEGDVYNHTMEVLDRTALESDDELIRFAALVHDFGKIATPKEMLPHHYNHEKHGDEFIRNFCNRLKMPNHYKKVGLTASNEHMRAGMFCELRTSKKVDFIVKNDRTILGLRGLEVIANCDKVHEQRIEFSKLGEQMFQEVNGMTIDLQNLSIQQINEKLRKARIDWMIKHL